MIRFEVMSTEHTLRLATQADVPAITAIYNDAIAKTVASFWMSARPENEAAEQLQQAGERYPWYVAERDGVVLGYVQSKPWNPRDAYARTCELTIYVAESARGLGVGSSLYRRVIEHLRTLGYANVIGGITLPNEPSVRLHEQCGFTKVAHFEEVGEKFGQILDVGYWQLKLDQG